MAEQRAVRAAAGEPVEVSLTVNGTPATLTVPARVTLADALREHLGLTGTHLGCEHGVCGMCTVLVDGEAARACLLFAVQCDGAEVLTVESLGRPDALHPLQHAFGRNHALQCGFCTPGFLMSAYDLLAHRPTVTDDELPAELSGVICRCTGYRTIVAAVAEARDAHPDGIPAPGNCGRHTLLGRGSHIPATAPPATEHAVPSDIVLPQGEPTTTVDISSTIAVPSDQVWRVFADVHLLARCLPGAELTDDLGENRYAGRARVSVGPIKLTFTGVAHLVEADRAGRRLRVLAQGRDTGGAQTQADILLRTEPAADGTTLHASAAVYLTGRIAQFGRALAGDISKRMFEQFADAVADAATGQAPAGPVRAPGAVRLLLATARERIRRALRRKKTPEPH